MGACQSKPKDKSAFVRDIGRALRRKHGKRKYYRPKEIERAANDCGYPIDWHCWAYAIFASRSEFRALHAASGEDCDYDAMKAEIIGEAATGIAHVPDVDPSWISWPEISWPEIDLTSLFDWLPWN